MSLGINNNVDSHHGGIVVHISPLRRNGDPLVVLRPHRTIELEHIVRSAKQRYIISPYLFYSVLSMMKLMKTMMVAMVWLSKPVSATMKQVGTDHQACATLPSLRGGL